MTPMVQFPWPLILGGGVGLALTVGVFFRGLRTRTLGPIAPLACALAGASAGAFVGLVWMWVAPMSRSVACLYSCAEVQFLSNEQFRQITLMTGLAWILPATALLSGLVALWSRRSGPRR